jgi:lipid II:glycine glycyltransferase (peptidoglycan interpeptide bridge formation enzyme)
MAHFEPYIAGAGNPTWNELVAGLPGAHLLQTKEWGMVKMANGWLPAPWAWRDEQGRVVGAALTLLRSFSSAGWLKNLSLLYVPKGPLLDWSDVALRRKALLDLADLARRKGAIFVKIDPDVVVGTGTPGSAEFRDTEVGAGVLQDLRTAGWRFSPDQVQFRNTVWIDLTPDLEHLLAKMKQKTRYNIRLAERKGVMVRAAATSDAPLLYQMYAETAARDDFVIRDRGYYQLLWSTMMDAGLVEPLIAEVEGEPVAGVVIFRFAGKAWYMQGMSRPAHREKMPNYLLQWEAMQRAKAAGCIAYDLWGAPDEFTESDPMWGVYRFKEGLGGQVVRHIGAWDLPVRPMSYQLYTRLLPRMLGLMRRRGKERTRRLVG